MRRALALPMVLAAACGGGTVDPAVDANGPPDPDAAAPDPDADLGVPRAGFGALTGMCGALETADLTSPTPSRIDVHLDFATDGFDDPAERPQLTPGGQQLVASPNAGGSSIFSETFAFEVMARCELASLVKLETDIVYDSPGSKTDILLGIDELKIGASVVRAMTFPLGDPYTEAAATDKVTDKLLGINESSDLVSAADAWTKQLLITIAYDDQHAALFGDAWEAASAELRADTILVLVTTDGDDAFIYTE